MAKERPCGARNNSGVVVTRGERANSISMLKLRAVLLVHSQASVCSSAFKIPDPFMHSHPPVGHLRYVDSSLLSRSLRPRGDVDSVAKETVARHPLSYHARHHLASVDADGNLLPCVCVYVCVCVCVCVCVFGR
ncbi:hypothetical protein E2C01_013283 [Portunus trituberculatus]|uniref:Uncharacterized protein n=1 Tax=Portunus trituberculatus TaxID=210409 RepID=A0A5B7DGI5_PORTR|nr:hypothetical protein [Portunus trituberculatus]